MDNADERRTGMLRVPEGMTVDAWAFTLTPEQLSEQIALRGLRTEGNAAQLRGRLTRYERALRRGDEGEPSPSPTIGERSRDFRDFPRKEEECVEEAESVGAVGGLPRGERLMPPGQGAVPRPYGLSRSPPHVVEAPVPDRGCLTAAEAYEKLRRWNVTFSGERGADAETFLRRVEEARGIAPISDDSLFRCLPFLLTGIALQWLRVEEGEWRSWPEFCRAFRAHFGDPDYQDVLRREISRRTQGEEEPVADFVTCVRVLMNRLDPPWTREEQITQVHRNMLPKLQIAVHRDDFDNFSSLVRLATRVQRSYVAASRYRAPPPPEQSAFPDVAYKAPPRAARQSTAMTATEMPEPRAQEEPRTDGSGRSRTAPPPRVGRGAAPREGGQPPPSRGHGESTRGGGPAEASGASRRALAVKCWNCGREGHFARECREPPQVHCYRCGKKQHTLRTCPTCAGNGGRRS